jgi:HEPN domain-containing protein
MDNIDIVAEWFEIADMDLSSAIFLQNMRPVPVEIICYHCQQSAEKYLKGFLAYKNEEIKKIHDLVLLNKLCQRYDAEFKSLENICIALTDYGVNVRYPFPMNLNETDVVTALNDCNKIKEFVLSRVKRNNSAKKDSDIKSR